MFDNSGVNRLSTTASGITLAAATTSTFSLDASGITATVDLADTLQLTNGNVTVDMTSSGILTASSDSTDQFVFDISTAVGFVASDDPLGIGGTNTHILGAYTLSDVQTVELLTSETASPNDTSAQILLQSAITSGSSVLDIRLRDGGLSPTSFIQMVDDGDGNAILLLGSGSANILFSESDDTAVASQNWVFDQTGALQFSVTDDPLGVFGSPDNGFAYFNLGSGADIRMFTSEDVSTNNSQGTCGVSSNTASGGTIFQMNVSETVGGLGTVLTLGADGEGVITSTWDSDADIVLTAELTDIVLATTLGSGEVSLTAQTAAMNSGAPSALAVASKQYVDDNGFDPADDQNITGEWDFDISGGKDFFVTDDPTLASTTKVFGIFDHNPDIGSSALVILNQLINTGGSSSSTQLLTATDGGEATNQISVVGVSGTATLDLISDGPSSIVAANNQDLELDSVGTGDIVLDASGTGNISFSASSGEVLVDKDPTTALGIATMQYVDNTGYRLVFSGNCNGQTNTVTDTIKVFGEILNTVNFSDSIYVDVTDVNDEDIIMNVTGNYIFEYTVCMEETAGIGNVVAFGGIAVNSTEQAEASSFGHVSTSATGGGVTSMTKSYFRSIIATDQVNLIWGMEEEAGIQTCALYDSGVNTTLNIFRLI